MEEDQLCLEEIKTFCEGILAEVKLAEETLMDPRQKPEEHAQRIILFYGPNIIAAARQFIRVCDEADAAWV